MVFELNLSNIRSNYLARHISGFTYWATSSNTNMECRIIYDGKEFDREYVECPAEKAGNISFYGDKFIGGIIGELCAFCRDNYILRYAFEMELEWAFTWFGGFSNREPLTPSVASDIGDHHIDRPGLIISIRNWWRRLFPLDNYIERLYIITSFLNRFGADDKLRQLLYNMAINVYGVMTRVKYYYLYSKNTNAEPLEIPQVAPHLNIHIIQFTPEFTEEENIIMNENIIVRSPSKKMFNVMCAYGLLENIPENGADANALIISILAGRDDVFYKLFPYVDVNYLVFMASCIVKRFDLMRLICSRLDSRHISKKMQLYDGRHHLSYFQDEETCINAYQCFCEIGGKAAEDYLDCVFKYKNIRAVRALAKLIPLEIWNRYRIYFEGCYEIRQIYYEHVGGFSFNDE